VVDHFHYKVENLIFIIFNFVFDGFHLRKKNNHSWEIIVFFRVILVCNPILQAKWSNKQKTKALCIKVHFVHFYPSIVFKNQMCPNTE